MKLSPFTLVFGDNSSGKTNLLNLIKAASKIQKSFDRSILLEKHFDALKEDQIICIKNDKEDNYSEIICCDGHKAETEELYAINGILKRPNYTPKDNYLSELNNVRLFEINPRQVGTCEKLTSQPSIEENGHGVVQVLDALKTGDKSALFDCIETKLQEIQPEIKKLILVPYAGHKRLQVRLDYLREPLLAESLSESIQRLIIFLAILYQEKRPSIICIKNIDRGLQKEIWEPLIELCFEISEQENGSQIIVTTQNPDLKNKFIKAKHKSAVVVTENQRGRTTFKTL